jgi:hypothetical protein
MASKVGLKTVGIQIWLNLGHVWTRRKRASSFDLGRQSADGLFYQKLPETRRPRSG